MHKPWVIGLFSIVPGLGFIVFGRVSQGFIVMALVAFFALGALFAPWEMIAAWSLVLGFCVWVGQIFYAWYYAALAEQRIADQEAGVALPEPPPGASLGERQLHEARQTMTRLLHPGECLQVALQGQVGSPPLVWGIVRALFQDYSLSSEINPVYLGITGQDFVLFNPVLTGKPGELQRVPFSQVKLVQSSEGLVLDKVVLDIGQARTISVNLNRFSRPGTRQFVNILSGKEAASPDAWEAVPRGLDLETGKPLQAIHAPAKQGQRSNHPVLLAAVRGASGGMAASLAAACLSFLGVLIWSFSETTLSSEPEGWGYLIVFYCLAMFPWGGAILGAIPGAIVGGLRASRDGPVILQPPFLAGFLTVVVVTLAGFVFVLAG